SASHLLSYHATHDALTNLVNRREFERRLSESLLQAKGFNYQHALCYLDLDQFKIINDTCGHTVGDRLLRQLSHLLSYHLRESDTLGRLGGDEFGILLHNCSLDQARQIGEKLCDTVRSFQFNWGDQVFELGVSIGLVPVNADSKDIQEILSEADAACYVAKEKGRGRIQIFQHGDAELAKRHGDMQWVSRLNWALGEGRFLLYSQPIISLSNNQECHYEILLRLRDENDDIVLPGTFIPAAERYNIMTNIDRWVIETAISRLGYYFNRNQDTGSHIWSINISGASLGDNTMLSFIQDQMRIHRVPARLLCFEITETAAVENIDQARKFMQTFKESGCHFSLDDFGSGLSSFNYLKNLPVDYVKIDGAFVKGIANNSLDLALVRSINDIGHAIGTRTIAEFVDSQDVMDKLREIGVDYAQGFLIAEPDMMDTYFR
ncbi:MAG: EAL domain-containing protein, partial [Gammaproteobacteria bacterium]|nr:EAL domain-containing protein [Gammaproteobacteria bacterium]